MSRMSGRQSKGRGMTAGCDRPGTLVRTLLLILMLGFAANTVLASVCAVHDAMPDSHAVLVDSTEIEDEPCCAFCSNCALGGCCAQAAMSPDAAASATPTSASTLTIDGSNNPPPDQLASDLLRVPIAV
jgi:hypothetical protein